jgi:hypothetical protein
MTSCRAATSHCERGSLVTGGGGFPCMGGTFPAIGWSFYLTALIGSLLLARFMHDLRFCFCLRGERGHHIALILIGLDETNPFWFIFQPYKISYPDGLTGPTFKASRTGQMMKICTWGRVLLSQANVGVATNRRFVWSIAIYPFFFATCLVLSTTVNLWALSTMLPGGACLKCWRWHVAWPVQLLPNLACPHSWAAEEICSGARSRFVPFSTTAADYWLSEIELQVVACEDIPKTKFTFVFRWRCSKMVWSLIYIFSSWPMGR